MKEYTALTTVKGYYCNMCDRYHAPDEIKHRYTVESMGEWNGSNGVTVAHEIECPNCGCRHNSDLEPFNLRLWSHLVAYQRATETPMMFECPVFDRATNGPTTGYEWVATADEVEKKADWYCIEVEDVRYDAEGIVVRLDFQ